MNAPMNITCSLQSKTTLPLSYNEKEEVCLAVVFTAMIINDLEHQVVFLGGLLIIRKDQ